MMGIHRNGLDVAMRKEQSAADYYRENNMPDSPENKSQAQSAAISPNASNPVTISRSLSNSSSFSGMNGAHSPHNSVNGRTPSPSSVANANSGQQLPPACGARQLSKLKRFLTTLQQFGSDISPEIGERVRALVLGLVNSHLSIEEFHAKLQEATNFPLRPFVIPFLKANLPLLQRELLHCSRMAKQTPQQYLAHNDHVLFDTSHSPVESQELVMSADVNENGKRRASPDRPKENSSESAMEPVHPAKRHHPLSPGNAPSRVSPNSTHALNVNGPIRLEDISMHREMRERERMERERVERERADRERHLGNFSNYHRPDHYDNAMLNRIDDDWKHVETMLHCIIDMVDKTKRALAVLQERSSRDREELSMWMRRHAEGLDQDMKKRTSEMMASTLRQTEDRVAEVKRRAEEAVNEVKRQAVLELQKAVAAAEQKANDLVKAERAKMERTINEAQKQAQEEIVSVINSQEESSESCWNCGRKASETCSGCNIARYCGSFCQHKDWENHHHVCGQANNTRSGAMGRRTSDSARTKTSEPTSKPDAVPSTVSATITSAPSPVSVTSPASSVAAPSNKSGSRSSTPAAENKSGDLNR